MKRLKRLAAKCAAPFKMGIWQALSYVWDYPIWIAAEIKLGVAGVVLVAIGAIAINFCALLYYRRKKVSWLLWDIGVYEIKENLWKTWLRTCIFLGIVFYEGSLMNIFFLFAFMAITFLFTKKVILRNRVTEDIFMFFVLSFYQDSFIATAYLRHDRCNGLERSVLKIFLGSSIVSVIYWVARMGIITEVFIRPLVK